MNEKLTFNDYNDFKTSHCECLTRISRKLNYYVKHASLLAIYNLFKRSRINYTDPVFDNANLSNLIQSAQCNVALAMTGAIGDSSEKKYYQH